jgi:hypothetical protein
MTSPEESRRLFPFVDERRRFLGLSIDRSPTSATFGKLQRGRPIQRTTLDNIDKRFVGPGGVPDGLWPPGTAHWLATGQIDRPGRRPEDMGAPAVGADTLKGLYALNDRIMSALPHASAERAERARRGLEAAWAALDERQGR